MERHEERQRERDEEGKRELAKEWDGKGLEITRGRKKGVRGVKETRRDKKGGGGGGGEGGTRAGGVKGECEAVSVLSGMSGVMANARLVRNFTVYIFHRAARSLRRSGCSAGR